jgi:LCP family protein required for cell wall assembly
LFNVLLLGGDEGPGRWALRTDTMILVSIHEPSGRIAMLSIPRNLRGVEFPSDSPMGREFPGGFPDLANAIYPYVYSNEEMAVQYQRGELSPEAVVLAQGLSYSLDVTIHDYVLVNMQGFLEIVDALGGVTMTLDERVPMPGNVPGAKRPYPDSIGPGVVEMDGTIALGFARSRSGDSDYGRMGRQRQLLEALASQTSGSDALVKFPDLANVLKFTVRTSLSTDEFGMLVDRMRAGADIQESTGLGPPFINPGNPNFEDCANLLDEMQDAIITGVDFPYS